MKFQTPEIQWDIILQKRPGSKFCFPNAHVQCMSELYCKFQILASNTVRGVMETETVVQCDMVKMLCHSRRHNSAKMTLIKIMFPLCNVQCMSELCCKFQIPASITVGGVAETRTVLQSVTDGQTYIHMYLRIRVKLYATPHFVAGA